MEYYSLIIDYDQELFNNAVKHLKSIGYTFSSDMSSERGYHGALTINREFKTMHFDSMDVYIKEVEVGKLIDPEQFCRIFDCKTPISYKNIRTIEDIQKDIETHKEQLLIHYRELKKLNDELFSVINPINGNRRVLDELLNVMETELGE